MKKIGFFALFLVLMPFILAEKEKGRDGKVLPVFQVVRFPNDPCIVETGGKNGTCYTSEECEEKGGLNGGSCASGFGVCCTFTLVCGSVTAENSTYFESDSVPVPGNCGAKICKLNSNICQIRLDFQSFVITGPSTSATTVTLFAGGGSGVGGKKVTSATQCLTDIFQVTNQNSLPVICGSNNGEHVYFDASDQCNDINFQLGNAAIDVSAIAQRKWNILITQYSCDYENLAPSGCDQWYFNPTAAGSVKSFNYDESKHLADQKQTICVRREAGKCRICWFALAATDVQVTLAAAGQKLSASKCCNYGAGIAMEGYDCIMLPGAMKVDNSPIHVSMCGYEKGLFTAATSTTICSKSLPFRIIFHSDSWEWGETVVESGATNKGFKVSYVQDNC